MKFLSTTAIGLTLLVSTGCAQAQSPAVKVDVSDRAQIEAVIKDYLMKNPEIVREALIELDRKEEVAMLNSIRDAIENDPRDVIIGPANAKVTMVEFFDYNCGFCKRSTDWVNQTLEAHPKDVRVIFKELPILDGRTKTSRNAAKAALAANKQGKYLEMHTALMEASGLSPERISIIAKDVGLDVKKLERDMKDPEIDALLEDTLILANRIPSLTGTPFFIINDVMIAGADTDRLQATLEAALEG